MDRLLYVIDKGRLSRAKTVERLRYVIYKKGSAESKTQKYYSMFSTRKSSVELFLVDNIS